MRKKGGGRKRKRNENKWGKNQDQKPKLQEGTLILRCNSDSFSQQK